jgi:hypothetical protein
VAYQVQILAGEHNPATINKGRHWKATWHGDLDEERAREVYEEHRRAPHTFVPHVRLVEITVVEERA